jgi:hypothetical protein
LTNDLSESDFSTSNKENNASNITNTTINSVKTDNSNLQLDLVTPVSSAVETSMNLRRYQSDDSIYSKYLTKLMYRKIEAVITKKKKQEDIEDKNQVLIDPLGAYLLTSSPPPNQPLCDPLIAFEDESNKNKLKENLVKLFEYQPFSSKQANNVVEEEEVNDQKCFCENDSFNDDNFDDKNYSVEDDENLDDDELDPFMVANDDSNEDKEEEDEEEEEEEEEEENEEEVVITKPTKSIDHENAILKDTNTLFSSFVQQVKQVTNLEKLKNVTMDKFENIKSTIQTNMRLVNKKQQQK